VRRILIATSFFAALVGLWQVGTMVGGWSPVLLPPPQSVAEYLWGALNDGSLVEASAVTLQRLLIGYAIGVIIGLPLGLLSSASDLFQDTIGT
jgi:NitT/TauT family transport system permease protein